MDRFIRREYTWGDMSLGSGASFSETFEDILVQIIGFVDISKHAEDYWQSLIQRNKN